MTINEKKSSSGILQWLDFTLPPINLWVMPIMEHIEMKRVSIDQASPEEWDAVRKKTMDSLKRQVGGSHYKGFKIEPIEFSMANNLNACQHSIIKYVVRNKGTKEQRIQDLNKARHFIDILEETILNEDDA